jgi:hypothetical protein
MTNKDFYAYCRDHRKTEPDVHKREALQDAYDYMRECGVTKLGVAAYIQHQIEIERKPRDAYNWIQSVFDGTSGVEQFGEELWR